MGSLAKLKEKLNRRKVIPFVGAGVSMNVEDTEGNRLFPSWKGLLENAIKELRNSDEEDFANLVNNFLNNKNDYLNAAKYARDGLKNNWNNFLDRQFNPDRTKVKDASLEIARLIWQLGSSLIITTNYDKVLRWTNETVEIWHIESKFRQGKVLSEGLPKEPTVWHLHGYVGCPAEIILTPDGYQKFYPNDEANTETKYKTAITTLRSLLTSYTFLFIGFSLNDANFVNQIKEINELFDGATGEHFVLVPESEKNNIEQLNLPVKPITYENHGEPLLKLLRELTTVEKYKDSISTAGSSTEQKELTATEKYNPKNRVVHIPFYKKGDQVVGREENLKNVRETLLQGLPTNIGQAVSFQGLGGLGKTQLAVEYAYEYEKEYPNGVIWLTVDQDIDKQLVEVCNGAEWVAPRSEIKVKLDVARHRLKTITDCLIVLDNVEIFDERIKEYLPAPRKDVHILATSRKILYGFEPIALKLLTPAQAVQMLEQESHRKASDENEKETITKIAEEVDFLPLALEHIGGFLHYLPNYSWEKFLSFLRNNPRKAFEGKFLEASFTEHEIDVYRTLKVSEDILNEEPLLRDVLDLLTWSGTSAMGVDLMCRLLDKKDYELEIALSLGETLRLLSKSPERNAYAIHRLVAEVRKEDIPLAERVDWINNICQLLGDWFQDIREDFNKLPEYEAELEHLAKWQEHAENFATENASKLLWLQGYPPYYRGKYKEAKEIVGKAIELYETTNCQNQETLAHLYNDFGSVLSELRKTQISLKYTLKSLEIRLGLFGERHRDTADSYHNLSLDYWRTNNPYKHLEYAQKSLDIFIELFGENDYRTAYSHNSLGLAYETLNNYEKAFEHKKKSLNIRLKLFGENNPTTATSFNNLIFYYEKLKDFKTAVNFAQKTLNIRREVLGNLHPDTLDSVHILADVWTKDNKGFEGLKLIDKFLRLVPKVNLGYKELLERKAWILSQTIREGFRQQPVNSAKKKGKKKRR